LTLVIDYRKLVIDYTILGSIPLDSIHMFWRRLSFSDQGLSEPQVTIKEEMETDAILPPKGIG